MTFDENFERAKANVIFRWLRSNSFKYFMGTHETQRFPAESAADALNFMQHTCPKVSEQNQYQNLLLTWIRPK